MHRRPFARLLPLLIVAVLAAPGCRALRLLGLAPDKPAVSTRDTTTARGVARPSRYTLRVAPYVFLSDVEIRPDMPLFRDLADLRNQVYEELCLPSADKPIYVYLFDSRERYERYMRATHPRLPRRRAFFIADDPRVLGTGEELQVFTFWGDRIRQDLRHELTHALLHSVLKNVPLWLDEGLAEFFELPPENEGVNENHLDHIRRSTVDVFRPDLSRLEALAEVSQMTPAEYRESWVWVHLMLRSTPEARKVLLNYLQQLRTTPNPGPLRPRLAEVFPALEECLSRHVAHMDPPRTVLPASHR